MVTADFPFPHVHAPVVHRYELLNIENLHNRTMVSLCPLKH